MFDFSLSFSVLPESPRWLISKSQFEKAERVLRRIAVDNQRNFEPRLFAQLRAEQEKVR